MHDIKDRLRPHADRILRAVTRGHARTREQDDAADFTPRTIRSVAHDLIFAELVSEFAESTDVTIMVRQQLRILCLPQLRMRLHYACASKVSVNHTLQTSMFRDAMAPGLTSEASSAVLFYEETAEGALDSVCVGRDRGRGSLVDFFELSELVASTPESDAQSPAAAEAPIERRRRFKIVLPAAETAE